jgi:hypothetical protein
MGKTRVFVSFDYDHDRTLKDFLVGQARLTDSPFELSDWSVKEAQATNWKDHARGRIKASDVVAVICGENTHTAVGVSAEIQLAREERRPYFLLKGYKDKNCTLPKGAENEKMYTWTWENLKALIMGAR